MLFGGFLLHKTKQKAWHLWGSWFVVIQERFSRMNTWVRPNEWWDTGIPSSTKKGVKVRRRATPYRQIVKVWRMARDMGRQWFLQIWPELILYCLCAKKWLLLLLKWTLLGRSWPAPLHQKLWWAHIGCLGAPSLTTATKQVLASSPEK